MGRNRTSLSLRQARRIALAAQGLDRPRPRGRVDSRHLRSVIRRLGLLQIDFVNVLVPAHYQVPFSRLGPYDRGRLDDLVYRRREFTEQWAHEASIVPVDCWPLLRHRRDSHRVRPWGFEKFLERNADYVERVMGEIRTRGALSAEDLPAPADGIGPRRDGWGWGRDPRRQVLESHFGFGRLAVAERLPSMARRYDLAERVIPAGHRRREIDPDGQRRRLLARAARAHGIGTAADLADYFRMPVGTARPRLAELVEAGELREVRVEGWREPAYLAAAARLPKRIGAAALLSPFDPVVWFRPRTSRLFGFDYSLEIFVPERKRRWGYYVLPFLLGDRLVARVDLKADRAARRLRVPAAHVEPGADPGPVAEALAMELRTLAGWLGLESVAVGRRGGFARALGAAVRAVPE